MNQIIMPAWITKLDDTMTNVFHECSGTIFIHGVNKNFICEDNAANLGSWQHKQNISVLVKLTEKTPFHLENNNATILESIKLLQPHIPFVIAKNFYGHGQLSLKQTQYIDTLFNLIIQLNTPLRQFLFNVFSNEEITKAFTTVNASINHHHAWKGGLLVHSVESAIMADQLAKTWMTPAEAEVTVVAALLHDIGKTRTFQENGHWSELGHYVSHDALSLEILAPYLTQLEKQWRTGANLLRHILGWDKNQKCFPAFPGTHLVKMCDQYSTALELRTATFKGKPHWHHHARHEGIYKQQFLRLPQ